MDLTKLPRAERKRRVQIECTAATSDEERSEIHR